MFYLWEAVWPLDIEVGKYGKGDKEYGNEKEIYINDFNGIKCYDL